MVQVQVALLGGCLCCVSAARENPAHARHEAAVGKDFVYKTSAGRERHIELFFPPGHDPAAARVPGLILFHGGGWQGGSLAQFRKACGYFASRGLVCATAEYRMLGPEDLKRLPAGESRKRVCVTDAKSAIRWFRQHAEDFGMDSSRIIAGGGSAGAHVSALATMNPGLNDPADPQGLDTTVAANLWFNPAFSPDDKQDPEISISSHIRAGLPPTFVVFGDRDEWKAGWDDAHDQWKSLGNRTIDLRIAKDQSHGFFNREPWQSVCLKAADGFLVRHGFLTDDPAWTAPTGDRTLVPAP